MNLILEFSVTIILIVVKAVNSELKSSLTFVIDDTGSMRDEIDQVKLRTKEVFEAVLNSKNSDIGNFVLVTFNDPGVQFRVKTTHEDEFMEALDEIDVDGGLITCPEMAMTGISLGIKSSNPNSFVYVFTDASAEDYHKYDDVERLASVFSTKVTFLLTGDCECRSCENYKVYNKLANATGGQVFNIEKNEIKNILDYIIDSIKTTKCLVSHRHFFSENQRKFELRFLVDNKLNEITLSLTGEKPQLKVFFSNGTEVMTSVLVTLSDTLILKMVNVVNEEYIAKVEVNGKEADLSINAACNFAFQYGFSQIPANSMDKTVYRPTSGGKEYLSIQITKQDDEVQLHTAQIRDVLGNIIMNLKLRSVNEKFYVTEEFMPPNQPFKIAVVGKFKSTNEEITRVALPTIEPAKVTPVTESTTEETTSTTETSIEMAPNIDEIKIVNSDNNGKVSIECIVSSNPKPDIEWMDNYGNTFSVFDVNYDESNPIIKTNTVLNTESKEDNIFKCTATNGLGTKSESIDYVSPKELPVIDKTVKEYFKNKDESIDIDCRVIKGKPKPAVTWYFKQQNNIAYVKLSSTGENLHIDNLNTDNAGFYKCVAENSVGSDEHKVEVQVTVVESTTQETTSTTEAIILMAPNIDEIKIVNSDDNGKVSIECIVSSNPKPDIEWMDKHGNTFSVFDVNYDESNPIIKTNTVLNTESKEDNIFTCTATNGLGTQSESIDYVSPKELPVIDKTVKKYFKNKDESIDIDCRVIKGKPKPSVTWYFKQQNKIAYVKLSSTGENLHIDNLNTDNAGFYKCVAENSVGSDEHKVEVQVTVVESTTQETTSTTEAIILMAPNIDEIKIVNSDDNGKVSIECIVSSNPKPDIEWMDKHGNTFSVFVVNYDESNPIIKTNTVLNTESKEDNIFTCTATNGLGTQSESIDYVSPKELPVIDKTVKKYFKNKDESIDIDCRVIKGKPKPAVTWYFKQQNNIAYVKLSSTDEILHIDNLNTDNAGFYKCVAENSVGSDEHKVEVQVTVVESTTQETTSTTETIILTAPNIDEIKIVNSDDNGKVSIECIVSSNPKPDIEWIDKYGNTFSVFVVNYDESNPIIKTDTVLNTESQEDNIFTCTATNGLGTKSQSIAYVSPKELPVIDKTVKEYFKNKDESIDIDCRVIKGKPKPVVTWYFKQQNNIAYVKLSSTDEILHIDNLNTDNAGFYKCVAENSVGSDEHKVEVQVTEPPQFTPKETTLTKAPATIVNLDCVVRGWPKPRVRWYFNDKEIVNGARYLIHDNHTLSFQSKPKDTGKFRCEIVGVVGNNNIIYNVEVKKFAPLFITPPLNAEIHLRIGDTKTLECNAGGVPEPTVQWNYVSFDSKTYAKINTDKSKNGNSLVLTGDHINKEGYYVCNASNGREQMSITYKVFVGVPPWIVKPPNKMINAVIEDKRLHIRCEAFGYPKPTVTWQKNGVDLAIGTNNLMTEGNLLIIYDVNDFIEISGKYTCIATNTVGTASEDYEVQVLRKPTIGSVQDLCIEKDKPKELWCSTDFRDTYKRKDSKIVWFIKDEYFITNPFKLNGYDHEAMTYICRISYTEGGIENFAINIKLCFPPEFYNDLPTHGTYVMNSYLDCRAKGSPAPTISWYKNGKRLPDLTDTLRADDEATYRCEVTNNFITNTNHVKFREFKVIRDECVIDIKMYSSKQRPFLSKKSKFIIPITQYDVENDLIRIPGNNKISFICPNNYIKFRGRNLLVSSLQAKCKTDSQFEIKHKAIIGTSTNVYDLECSEEPKPHLRNPNIVCNYLDDYQMINVGFKLVSTFQIMYSVCFNVVTKEPTYARYEIYHFGHRTVRPYEYENSKYTNDEAEVYDCDWQRNFFIQSFGFDMCPNKCCYIRRQLVNPQDLYPSYEAAAFNNINVVPHWSSCSTNWNQIEERILAKAKINGEKFEIWTGIYDRLELESYGLIKKPVAIRNTKFMPKLLWKVVHSKILRAAIAIIQINSPNILDPKEIEDYVICPDITDNVKWMHNPDWKDPSKGYTYICGIKEFLKAFNRIIFLKGVKRTLV